MEFYTSFYEKRPVRLSEETLLFAWESLHHKYGLDTMKTMYVPLDHIEGVHSLSALERYDLAVEEIVRRAPLRICENERVSGAATLGGAICHQVPALLEGKAVFSSISHLTIDFLRFFASVSTAFEKTSKNPCRTMPAATECHF